MWTKRGILFRTGKELRDRVNHPDDEPTAAAPATPAPDSGNAGGGAQ